MIYYGDIAGGDCEDFWIVTGKLVKFFLLIYSEAISVDGRPGWWFFFLPVRGEVREFLRKFPPPSVDGVTIRSPSVKSDLESR